MNDLPVFIQDLNNRTVQTMISGRACVEKADVIEYEFLSQIKFNPLRCTGHSMRDSCRMKILVKQNIRIKIPWIIAALVRREL